LPRLAADTTEAILGAAGVDGTPLDLLSPDVARAYFREYYGRIGDKDGGGITQKRSEHRFHEVERDYSFVGDSGATIWVPFDDQARSLLDEVSTSGPTRRLMQRLQRYTVTVYPAMLDALRQAGHLDALASMEDGPTDLFALRRLRPIYSQRFGLNLSSLGMRDYEANII
jgi:hypothetical protein